MVSFRTNVILIGTVVASALLVAAAPATTPVPNRRSLIGKDTYSEIAKRSSYTGSECGFSSSNKGQCFLVTDAILTTFLNDIWSIISSIFGGKKPSTTTTAKCICLGFDDDLYCPSSYSIPSLDWWNQGLASKYTAHKTCSLPTNCSPNPTSDKCCDYTCPYGTCGTGCLASGQVCVSGVPTTPAHHRRSSSSCPSQSTRCPTSNSASSARFECVNTESDLYSCGGCLYADPFTNSTVPAGQDCTAIPNASEVSCQSGACLIEACEIGYDNVPGKGCVYSEKMALKLQKYRL